jgi:two-component system, chemotaxis family, chemotaxis protein CheY
LQGLNHTLVEAANGREGLAAFHAMEHCDLVISDILMPVQGGIEFIKDLRNDERGKGVPVVFLTAEFSPNLKQEAKALGVLAWVLKPFRRDIFLTVLRKALEPRLQQGA